MDLFEHRYSIVYDTGTTFKSYRPGSNHRFAELRVRVRLASGYISSFASLKLSTYRANKTGERLNGERSKTLVDIDYKVDVIRSGTEDAFRTLNQENVPLEFHMFMLEHVDTCLKVSSKFIKEERN